MTPAIGDGACEAAPLTNDAAGKQAGSVSQSQEAAAQDDVNDWGWRDELSARLNRYRSRHKMRPPRYPSLKLPFDSAEPAADSDREFGSADSFKPLSDRALALDGLTEIAPEVSGEQMRAEAIAQPEVPVPQPRAKVIEFPRFAWAPPSPPPDQLAEPVMDRPRILDVPEVAPPPPALGGITIEPAVKADFEKRPGIDIPLQGASLERRILAGVVDALIVGAASAMFAYVFWKVAAVTPPLQQRVGLAIVLPFVLWAAYQYLMIVYAGSTPGLWAAGLALARFDGSPARRSLRRWRVLASYLSAVSLGMGYAWVFLDEDGLCWHDRTTHTYLAPKPRSPKA